MSGYMRIVGHTFGSWRRRLRVDVRVDFVPRDLWVGLYVGKTWYEGGRKCQSFYVCVAPTLPIVVTTMRAW
jgi:hypothetical protein